MHFLKFRNGNQLEEGSAADSEQMASFLEIVTLLYGLLQLLKILILPSLTFSSMWRLRSRDDIPDNFDFLQRFTCLSLLTSSIKLFLFGEKLSLSCNEAFSELMKLAPSTAASNS
ncbi:hypothetical protein OUZ56_024404 [Daphnia magna]|uniref:Uncharacterized protein n=1 Tax=Daphnia magna TaxID=35525 RepID=A0ABR0B115_9CRUS|nr:hypothetical protein OUZ56_024404 [Daphnia magna]